MSFSAGLLAVCVETHPVANRAAASRIRRFFIDGAYRATKGVDVKIENAPVVFSPKRPENTRFRRDWGAIGRAI